MERREFIQASSALGLGALFGQSCYGAGYVSTGQGCARLAVTAPKVPDAARLHPQLQYMPFTDLTAATARMSGANHDQIDSNRFRIDVDDFDDVEVEQARPDYCWAAAVSMVLEHHNITVTQESVVRRIMGRNPEGGSAANLGQIVCALNRWSPSGSGSWVVQATPFATNPLSVLAEIGNNRPMVVGMKEKDSFFGHVCVLTGVEYSFDQFGRPHYHELSVFDPYPDRGSLDLEPSEYNELVQFGIIVWAARV